MGGWEGVWGVGGERGKRAGEGFTSLWPVGPKRMCMVKINPMTHHHHARGGELISSDRGVAELFEDLANAIAKLPTV